MSRLLPLLLAALLTACGEDEPAQTSEVEKPAATASPAGKPAGKADQAGAPAAAGADAPPEAPQPTALPEGAHPALTNPALAQEQAPARYKVRFQTSAGDFVIEVTRAWAPNGADRFYNLCKIGYFDEARFFRNIPGFMVQWGMSAYPAATEVWQEATIEDDPVVQSNKPLFVTFAKTNAPNSRSTQIFINHGDNANLDPMGFAPFGKVVEGADVVKKLYGGYGEGAPRGRGPSQGIIAAYGNVYLATEFPKLDWIKATEIL